MSNPQWHAAVSKGCIGVGMCVAVAPDHFEFSNGRAHPTTRPVQSAQDIDVVRAAAEACPTAAISILATPAAQEGSIDGIGEPAETPPPK